MVNNKLVKKETVEYFGLGLVILFIIIHAIIRNDNVAAIIDAVCGITYTFLAGKGKPICYLFGITASFCYSFLSFKNALYANLLLYSLYYIPMQILGYFNWNKNLKNKTKEIIKIRISRKEFLIILALIAVLSTILSLLLIKFNNPHPIFDSVTTVVSVAGLYLTVRRAIEQWVCWTCVNALYLVLWTQLALSGERVYSMVIKWAIYLFLAIYFYLEWKREIDANRVEE